MDPPIVLIGGTAGSGKTTLANRLLARFDLDHRLGTGFIRAVVQSQANPTAEPWLFVPSYHAEDPVTHLRLQSRRIQAAVLACVERARAEGTSLVVEGTHVLPELYHDARARCLVLVPPEPPEHRRRLTGLRHTRRTVSDTDFAHIQELGRFYEHEAHRFGVPTLCSEDNLDQAIDLLGLGAGGGPD